MPGGKSELFGEGDGQAACWTQIRAELQSKMARGLAALVGMKGGKESGLSPSSCWGLGWTTVCLKLTSDSPTTWPNSSAGASDGLTVTLIVWDPMDSVMESSATWMSGITKQSLATTSHLNWVDAGSHTSCINCMGSQGQLYLMLRPHLLPALGT